MDALAPPSAAFRYSILVLESKQTDVILHRLGAVAGLHTMCNPHIWQEQDLVGSDLPGKLCPNGQTFCPGSYCCDHDWRHQGR